MRWVESISRQSIMRDYLCLLGDDNKGKEIFPPLAFNCIARISLLIFLMPLCFGTDHNHCSFGVYSIKMIFCSYNPLYHIITFFFVQNSNCYLSGIMVIYALPNPFLSFCMICFHSVHQRCTMY